MVFRFQLTIRFNALRDDKKKSQKSFAFVLQETKWTASKWCVLKMRVNHGARLNVMRCGHCELFTFDRCVSRSDDYVSRIVFNVRRTFDLPEIDHLRFVAFCCHLMRVLIISDTIHNRISFQSALFFSLSVVDPLYSDNIHKFQHCLRRFFLFVLVLPHSLLVFGFIGHFS